VLKEALKKPRKQQHEQQQQEQQPEQTSVVASLGAQSKLAVLACTSVTCFFIDMAAGIGVGVVLTKLLAKFPSSNKKPPEVAL
jgi:MFS superfamily sulfate permease-like transporter